MYSTNDALENVTTLVHASFAAVSDQIADAKAPDP
jgi:hypothetical protein